MTLAYSHQSSSDFRLKRRDCNNQNSDQKTIVKILQSLERELPDEQLQDKEAYDENEYDGAEKPFAASAFEKIHYPVNHQPDENQFDGNNPQRVVCYPSEIQVYLIDECFHKSNPFVTAM